MGDISVNRAIRLQTIRPACCRRGLTLVEILVVVGVIGLLLVVLMPSCQRSNGYSRRANCSSNMRNVSMAVHGYTGQNGEAIPVGVYKSSRFTAQSAILPQLEMANIQKLFGTFAGTADTSSKATSKKIPIYNCPSDYPQGTYSSPGGGTYARSSFVFCFGADTMEPRTKHDQGVFRVGATSSFDTMAVDGTSNTVMVSETISGKTPADPSGAWGYGEAGSSGYTHKNPPRSGTGLAPILARSATDFSNAVGTASSMHPGLVNVMYADHHGAQVSTEIDPAIWRAIATTDGHEQYESGE
ncbi:MAG: DUF1559 domain-containing protein [Planctomycetes bacterium]|nr:DUF1559 domain-containing protein [Planctomycetota bacterium]